VGTETHSDAWRLWVFFGMFAFMAVLETLASSRPWHDARWKRFGFHAWVALVNTVLMRLLFVPPLLWLATEVHARGWGLNGLIGLTGWIEVAVTFVLFDLYDYHFHRVMHRVPLFWRFHRAHHSDTHVDLTTSLRFHIGEFAISTGFKALWIISWGPSLFAFALFEAGITFFSQFHHSNIDLPEPLERIVRLVHMTPRLHAAHHTTTLRTRDKNFTTVFLWWDHIFGTFAEADRKELKSLGLPEGRKGDLSYKELWLQPVRMGP